MSELNQLMLEHEQFLESALDDMEFGGELSQEQVDCIRQACGKPKHNVALKELFDDFGSIFGGQQ